MARELGEQLVQLAERAADPMHPAWRRMTRSGTPCSTWATTPPPGRTWNRGSPSSTRRHSGPRRSGKAWRLGCGALLIAANTLWCLGYPAQAVQRSQEALALAQELAHPFSLLMALALGRLSALPPPRGVCGPGAGRSPPERWRPYRICALVGAWDVLAGLGAGNAGTGGDGPGASAPGHGGHSGHGADGVAAILPDPARRGRRAHRPGCGRATLAG